MSRKILFKAKTAAGDMWVEGLPHKDYDGDWLISNGVDTWCINHNTLCQFTGLLDKNGNLIWEGDIVRWDDRSNGKYWRVAAVEFNPDLRFRIVKIDCDFIQSCKPGYVFKFGNFIYTDTHNHLEVIGNIHEEREVKNG